jgi:hypothetical protein
LSDATFKLALSLTLGVAWVIEIWTARAMSPSRRLIANALIRRLGWPAAFLGLIVVAVPYYNSVLGVLLLGPGLLAAAHNLDRVWLACSLGEDKHRALLLRAAASGRLPLALIGSAGSGLLVALAGGTVILLSSNGQRDWSFWFGLGVALYGLIVGISKSLYILRIHRDAASGSHAV